MYSKVTFQLTLNKSNMMNIEAKLSNSCPRPSPNTTLRSKTFHSLYDHGMHKVCRFHVVAVQKTAVERRCLSRKPWVHVTWKRADSTRTANTGSPFKRSSHRQSASRFRQRKRHSLFIAPRFQLLLQASVIIHGHAARCYRSISRRGQRNAQSPRVS